MQVREFLRWFILSKLIRKFQQVAMVIFVGTILGSSPSPYGIIGFLLFFLVYLNTYFYNDLIDYEDDKKKGAVYKEKALVLGYTTPKEFLVLMANLTPITIFLATIWDPLLGFFSVIALLLNNLRTHVRSTVLRQILLMLVELFNFEAFWTAFFGGTIPAIFIPLFLAYSALYALGHAVYKLRKKGTLDNIVRSREMRNLIVMSVFAVLFSVPSLFLSTYHFTILVLGLLLYALPMYRLVSRKRMDAQETAEEISVSHNTAITVVSIVLLVGALLYLHYGSPFNVYIPVVKEINAQYVDISTYFDQLQRYILQQMFGDVRGIRARYDHNKPCLSEAS